MEILGARDDRLGVDLADERQAALVAEQAAIADVTVFKGAAVDIGLAGAGVGARQTGAASASVADGADDAVLAGRPLGGGDLLASAVRRIAAQGLARSKCGRRAQHDAGRVDLAAPFARCRVAIQRAVASITVVEPLAIGVDLAGTGVGAGLADALLASVADAAGVAIAAGDAGRQGDAGAGAGLWLAGDLGAVVAVGVSHALHHRRGVGLALIGERAGVAVEVAVADVLVVFGEAVRVALAGALGLAALAAARSARLAGGARLTIVAEFAVDLWASGARAGLRMTSVDLAGRAALAAGDDRPRMHRTLRRRPGQVAKGQTIAGVLVVKSRAVAGKLAGTRRGARLALAFFAAIQERAAHAVVAGGAVGARRDDADAAEAGRGLAGPLGRFVAICGRRASRRLGIAGVLASGVDRGHVQRPRFCDVVCRRVVKRVGVAGAVDGSPGIAERFVAHEVVPASQDRGAERSR